MLRPIALLAALLAALPARGGDIRGTVRYAGTLQAPPPIPVTKDRSVCGDSVPDESLLVREGRLANAVVRLRGGSLPAPPPAAGRLDQKRCRYLPHVQVLPVGSTLELASSDALLHNVHGWMGRMTRFNQAMAGPGEAAVRKLDRTGLVHVKCDVHDWMEAWIVVTDGPAAVTGPDGGFAFHGLPPGSYTLVVWQERLGEQVAQVVVPAEGTATAEITYR